MDARHDVGDQSVAATTAATTAAHDQVLHLDQAIGGVADLIDRPTQSFTQLAPRDLDVVTVKLQATCLFRGEGANLKQ
jgi:hypothetical protein